MTNGFILVTWQRPELTLTGYVQKERFFKRIGGLLGG